jgi:hypothetical protein
LTERERGEKGGCEDPHGDKASIDAVVHSVLDGRDGDSSVR